MALLQITRNNTCIDLQIDRDHGCYGCRTIYDRIKKSQSNGKSEAKIDRISRSRIKKLWCSQPFRKNNMDGTLKKKNYLLKLQRDYPNLIGYLSNNDEIIDNFTKTERCRCKLLRY